MNFKHVEFWGKKSQEFCFEKLASSVCSLVPSSCGDAFPTSAIESFAQSTPVVGFDVGGLGNLVSSSQGGLLVDPNNIENFIQSVNNLIKDPKLAEQLGKSGKNYVETFS